MRYRKLGHTGLDISVLCLGTMSFGDNTRLRGGHAWSLNEDDSRKVIRQAVEGGINFFDTANVYADGTSEEYVGRALRDFANRDEIVLATKVYSEMRPGPNGRGLSRKALLSEIDNSLRRLSVDYIDLYQIHRWDGSTPIEETLEALDDIVSAGKARYIGASSMYAWQFAKALHVSERNGWSQFVAMQNHYNLLYREEEREMIPLCRDEGIGIIPWSPLARGRLTREWDSSDERTKSDQYGKTLYHDGDRVIVDRVVHVARSRGLAPAQVAIAWLLGKSYVNAPIIGAFKCKHLTEALAAVDISLSNEEVTFLEEAYEPHEVAGIDMLQRRDHDEAS